MKSYKNCQALFSDSFWLWSRSSLLDERDRRLHFRRCFELDNVPQSVEVRVTADSYYTLYVNGMYVNRGPARGFQRHWPFDRIDLAPYLRKGRNVLAVLVYQLGISNYSYAYEDSSGFLLSGKVDTLNIGTDDNWKFREAPGYIRAVARGSGQYCFQEFFDCRNGDDDWVSLGYDDSAWLNISVKAENLRTVGVMPWHEFEERHIPLLTNDILKPSMRIAISRHRPAENWREIQHIGWIYNRENPVWEAAPGNAESIEFTAGITAQLIDFGKEVVGNLIFDAVAEDDGECLDYMIAESLSGISPDFPDASQPPTTLFGGRLILKQRNNHHELTMPWGFRYLVLLRRGSGTIIVSASVRNTIYPLLVDGTFISSDKRLNEIWKISAHTQRCCMVDAYIDCPWRENAQWWGDALVQSQNTFRLSADSRLMERGLRQISKQKTPNGLTYGMAPTCGHRCILPDYSAMWIVTLMAHYRQTGSPEMWLELRETADGILNYFQEQCEETGLLSFDPRYWLFLDWCPALFKKGIPTVLNLIYLWALQSAHDLAVITDDMERARRFEMEKKRLQQAITAKLYNSETQLLYDGITHAGVPVTTASPHAAALGILLDLLPQAHDTWLEKILLPLLRGDRKLELLPSSYFMYYIFEAVKLKGYHREVIDNIRRWWSEFVECGLSTTPENWLEKTVPGRMSMCHAWSAHPLVHFSEILLGVRQLAPGWEKISFDPLMTPGEKVSGSVPTPFGTIEVSWDWTAAEPKKNIRLPSGIKIVDP